MSANKRQPGGDHYIARTQAWDFIADNKLNPFAAEIVWYLTRWERKGNPLDLEKASHYFEKMRELVSEGRLQPSGGPGAQEAFKFSMPPLPERGPLPHPVHHKELEAQERNDDPAAFRHNRNELVQKEKDRITEENRAAKTLAS